MTVHVEVYAPEYAYPGTATAKFSATFDGPSPVPVFALKIGMAVGAVAPAGTVIGYADIVFVGSEQLPMGAETPATPVTVLALVGSVSLLEFMNVVEVTSMFQPFPVPVSSSGTRVSDKVLV